MKARLERLVPMSPKLREIISNKFEEVEMTLQVSLGENLANCLMMKTSDPLYIKLKVSVYYVLVAFFLALNNLLCRL